MPISIDGNDVLAECNKKETRKKPSFNHSETRW